MSAPYEIRDVEHLGGFRLRLTFADGLVNDIDLATKLAGVVGPVFEPLRDPTYFAQVRSTRSSEPSSGRTGQTLPPTPFMRGPSEFRNAGPQRAA